MFARKNSIPARDIQKMFSSSVKTAHTELFLYKKHKKDTPPFRCAILVPKKVAKTAVARHQNKRLVARAVAHIQSWGNQDFVLTLKKDIRTMPIEDIVKDLVKVCI